MKDVKTAFQAEYAQLDGVDDFHDLAVKRLAQARQAADQPLRCYALYLEARDLAVRGADPALALRIVEEMGKAYAFDVRAAKVEMLGVAGAGASDPGTARAFLDAAVPVLRAPGPTTLMPASRPSSRRLTRPAQSRSKAMRPARHRRW